MELTSPRKSSLEKPSRKLSYNPADAIAELREAEKVSKIDIDSETVKLFNGTYWAKYEGKWYGSFTTLAGAKAWLEAQADESL